MRQLLEERETRDTVSHSLSLLAIEMPQSCEQASPPPTTTFPSLALLALFSFSR